MSNDTDSAAANPENTWDWLVLTNAQAQHAIWPAQRDLPEGWTQVGPVGSKDECLAYAQTHWSDLRPLGAR